MLRRRRGACSRSGPSSGSLVSSPSARSSTTRRTRSRPRRTPARGTCWSPGRSRRDCSSRVTPALFAAGAYLRENADPSDVIATNRVINGTTRVEGEHNRDFSVSALGGLRTDVSGFGYACRISSRPRAPSPTSSSPSATHSPGRGAGARHRTHAGGLDEAYVTRAPAGSSRTSGPGPCHRPCAGWRPRCSSTTASTSTGSTLPAADPVRAGPGQGPAGAGAALGADTVSSRPAGASSAAVSSPPPSSCVGSSSVVWTTSTSDRRSSRRSGAAVASSASAGPRCESRAARRLSRRSLARSNSSDGAGGGGAG